MVTTRSGARSNTTDYLMFEELVPSSGWSEDSDNHLLIIDLPGFHVGEVKLLIDDYGRIVAKGERQVSENKHVRFEQSFEFPENSNIDDTTAKFDDEILYIIIPKNKQIKTTEGSHLNLTAGEENQHQTPDDAEIVCEESQEIVQRENGKFQRYDRGDLKRKEGRKIVGEMTGNGEEDNKFQDLRFACLVYEESSLRKVGLELKKHKGVIFTAIIAFSLGFFLSNKFQSNQK